MKKDEDEEYNDETDSQKSDEPDPEDNIHGRYESVKRTKHKFHCVLNDVMIHIKGKDFIVKKMTADVFY